MSRPSLPSSFARLITVAALAVWAAGAGATVAVAEAPSPQAQASADASKAAVHRSAANNDKEIRDYWTPARMRAAKKETVPPERHKAPAQLGSLGARSAPGAPGQHAVMPRSTVTLLSLSSSAVWTAHGQMPATTVGKLFFTEPDGDHECTASVIGSANRSLIWTAGHCVSDANGHWYSNWMFAPDYSDGSRPFGTWTWKNVSTPTGYLNGGDRDRDLAAIALWPRNGSNVADVTGWQGYKFNYGYDWNAYEFGYPYDTHPARSGITGQQLRWCVGQTWRPGIWPFQPSQQGIHCDQGHGASGGPWLDDLQLARGWGYLVGNVSYHPDDNSDEERSPHFGDAAVNVYNAEQGV